MEAPAQGNLVRAQLSRWARNPASQQPVSQRALPERALKQEETIPRAIPDAVRLAGGILCSAALLRAPQLRRQYGRRWRSRCLHSRASAVPTSAPEEAWDVARVRQAYIDFFRTKGHDFIKSSPVVPLNDPTLLFANAGMNQFKAIFLGQLDPSSPLQGVQRAANSQKCIRAGGKHNDLDDVGRDNYHHTFFEMLGNWSFGDYFKEEAIDYAWELLTQVYKLDPQRLYASYFGGDEELNLPADEEARELWLRYLPKERVLPFGKGDNFWEMGAVGPCGPCSEIHYDRIGGRDASALVNDDDPDVLEIWNLVFMQFYRGDDGKLTVLPNQHIDTGMGLERVTSILQQQSSNYDTNIFSPLFAKANALVGGEAYAGRFGKEDAGMRDMAYRVIVDHARTLTLAITDGAQPSNEGRGYVLRRILRRAVRFGRQMMDAPKGFMSEMVPAVVESLGDAFPELKERQAHVQEILLEEEEAFAQLLERGMLYFNDLRQELEGQGAKVVPGERAFLLYDTHGFPLDLTQQMAEEVGMTVDAEGFQQAMEKQKESSREAQREKQALERGMKSLELVAEQTAWLAEQGIVATADGEKYEKDVAPQAKVQAIYSEKSFVQSSDELAPGDTVGVVLDRTSFYSEAGGQVSDIGELQAPGGEPILKVGMVGSYSGFALHEGIVTEGTPTLKVGDPLTCSVDYERRSKIAVNHTMTHVLNWALREVFGNDVDQAGSLVNDEVMRFDFTAKKTTAKQIKRVEELVNDAIAQEWPVSSQEVPLKEALNITGVRAMAGDAYPDPVRVIVTGPASISEVLEAPTDEKWMGQSVEFCGGTHIQNTSEASTFVILEEKAIAKGVRRVIAATGEVAKAARQEGERFTDLVAKAKGKSEADIVELGRQIDAAQMPAVIRLSCREKLDTLKKKAVKKNKKGAKAAMAELKAKLNDSIQKATDAGEMQCVVQLKGVNGKTLQQAFPNNASLPLLVLSADDDGGITCVATVPESQQSQGGADEWLKAVLAPLNGKGGGRPNRAQGSADKSMGDSLEEAASAAEGFWAERKG